MSQTGYTTRALLAPVSYFSYIATAADGITINDRHMFADDNDFIECYVLPESVKLASATYAEEGALQQNHTPTMFIPGEGAELYDLLCSLANEPMLLLLHDPYNAGGYYIQLGSQDLPLHFQSRQFMSAGQYEGIKGWQVNGIAPVRYFLNPDPTLLQVLESRARYLNLQHGTLSDEVYNSLPAVVRQKSSLLLPCIGEGPGYAMAVDSLQWPVPIPFTRSSTAMRYNEAGLPEMVAAGIPRRSYHPITHACTGYLCEPQRTNLVTRSETAVAGSNTAAWGSYSISGVTLSVEIAMHGIAHIYKLAENTNNGSHIVFSGNGGLSGSSGKHTLSFQAKANGRAKLSLNNGTTVNLTTGSSSNTALTTATDMGGGWWEVEALLVSNVGIPTWQVSLLNGSDASNYTGDGSSGILMRMVQVESGEAATSYIPTSGTTATRQADIFDYDDAIASGYLPDGTGTTYMNVPEISNLRGYVSAGIAFVPEATHTNLGTATLAHDYTDLDLGNNAMRLANQYNATTLKEYVNGTNRFDISYNTSTGLQGFYLHSGLLPMHLRALAFFYNPLLNAELMQITAS